MMREKLEALCYDLDRRLLGQAADDIREILTAEPDPSLRDAVVDIVWEGERRQLGVDHTADRICALFEGAGGLHSATCPRCFLSFTCTGGCNE